MSKRYITKSNLPALIFHFGAVVAILLVLSAVVSAFSSLPLTLSTYKNFYMARETALYGIVVAFEAIVGSYTARQVLAK